MANYERILITGGAGFVGSHVSAALAGAYPGAARIVVCRPGERCTAPGWAARTADITVETDIDALVAQAQPDLVVHLAGQASMGQAMHAAALTWRSNFVGAFNLATAIERHAPCATVLFSSSATVYGASLREGAATEDTPPRPLDSYSRSKLAAEMAMADVLPQTARLIVARPVNHSGPGQKSLEFVLSSFAAQIARIEAGEAEPCLHVGDLGKARDFLDVRDVADAYVRLIGRASELPERGNCFNIASGEPRTIQSLLDELSLLSRRPFDVFVDQNRLRPSKTDVPAMACDATRLRRTTGWRPCFSSHEMLHSLLETWRADVAAKQVEAAL